MLAQYGPVPIAWPFYPSSPFLPNDLAPLLYGPAVPSLASLASSPMTQTFAEPLVTVKMQSPKTVANSTAAPPSLVLPVHAFQANASQSQEGVGLSQAMMILSQAASLESDMLDKAKNRVRRRHDTSDASSSSSTADLDSDSEYEEAHPAAKRPCLKEITPTQTRIAGYVAPVWLPDGSRSGSAPTTTIMHANASSSFGTMTPPKELSQVPQNVGLHAFSAPASSSPADPSRLLSSHPAMQTAIPNYHINCAPLFSAATNAVAAESTHQPLSPPNTSFSNPVPSAYANREWAFKHAHSDWAKFNWHVRSGGRYIMTERAHRRYFACDNPDCPAVLYEDSPVEPKTGDAIKGGEIRMTPQKEHNHPPPEHSKPCNDLILRAGVLLKTMLPPQVRDQLIAEAGNGIGIPSIELITQILEKNRIIRKGKRTLHFATPHSRF